MTSYKKGQVVRMPTRDGKFCTVLILDDVDSGMVVPDEALNWNRARRLHEVAKAIRRRAQEEKKR